MRSKSSRPPTPTDTPRSAAALYTGAPAAPRLFALLAAIVILLIVFALTVRGFLKPDNLLDITEQVSVNTIIALGITLTILIGGIDLSVGSVLALAGTVTAYILRGTDRLPAEPSAARLMLAVGAGLGVALVVGAVNGTCAAFTRMPPFIITLATMLVARGWALRFSDGQPISVPENQSVFLGLGAGRLFHTIPVPVVVMLAVFVAVALLLHRTRFGQHVYALGGSREAARFSGLPVARIEMSAYLLCSALAGLAGMIRASRLFSADPNSGQYFELDAIAAAAVGGTSFTGGTGTLFGTLLGAILMGILGKGLNQAGAHFSLQYVIRGAVILAAVFIDGRGRK